MNDESQDKKNISDNIISITKDSPVRSISKAISWRIIASATTFFITYVIFSRFTNSQPEEVIRSAAYITALDVVAKLILYYFHERLWTNIKWGKYWSRNYWVRQYLIRKYRRKMNKRKKINNI